MLPLILVCLSVRLSLASGTGAFFPRGTARDRVRLLARIAHMKVATLLPKLAVTAELIVFDADLLFLPALGQHSVAAGCVPPLFLPVAVWAAGGSVIKALASCAPVLRAGCLPGEALHIYTWVHPGPGLVGVIYPLPPARNSGRTLPRKATSSADWPLQLWFGRPLTQAFELVAWNTVSRHKWQNTVSMWLSQV